MKNGSKVEKLLVVNKERLYMESVGAVRALADITDGLEAKVDKLASKPVAHPPAEPLGWRQAAFLFLLIVTAVAVGYLMGSWSATLPAAAPVPAADGQRSPVLDSLCREVARAAGDTMASSHPLAQLCGLGLRSMGRVANASRTVADVTCGGDGSSCVDLALGLVPAAMQR